MYCSSPNEEVRYKPHKCFRQKLQDRFDNEARSACIPTPERPPSEKSVLSSLSNLSETSERVIRSGAEKISRTLNNMRTSLGSFSQRFRNSTKRRQRLEEGPMTPATVTPQARTREVLGRTPTKLYSPFGIESPIKRVYHSDKENIPPKNESWISKKKAGKKLKNVKASMAKLNNIVNTNRYTDITPEHKNGCAFNYPIKLRS